MVQCYKDVEQPNVPLAKGLTNRDHSTLEEWNICRVHKGIQGDLLAIQDLPLNVHESSREDQSWCAWQDCREKAHLHIVENHMNKAEGC